MFRSRGAGGSLLCSFCGSKVWFIIFKPSKMTILFLDLLQTDFCENMCQGHFH